jgi:hypothetical protein
MTATRRHVPEPPATAVTTTLAGRVRHLGKLDRGEQAGSPRALPFRSPARRIQRVRGQPLVVMLRQVAIA